MEAKRKLSRSLKTGIALREFKVRAVRMVRVLQEVRKETDFIPLLEDSEMAAKLSHLRPTLLTKLALAELGESLPWQEPLQLITLYRQNPILIQGSEPQSTLSNRSSTNLVNVVKRRSASRPWIKHQVLLAVPRQSNNLNKMRKGFSKSTATPQRRLLMKALKKQNSTAASITAFLRNNRRRKDQSMKKLRSCRIY